MKNVHRVLTVDHLFTYLCNNNFFANEYSSVSSAFSSSIFCRWSGRKLFIVVLETVVLCCSNGIAKRRLNVSSKTYCEIWNNECWMTNTPHQNDITIADLLIFCQSKVGHGCKITFCAGQHYSVSFVWGHWWLIVATNESQIWKHSRLSVDGQIAFTSGEFIQVDSVPIFAWSEQPLRFTVSTINTIETHQRNTVAALQELLACQDTSVLHSSMWLHVERVWTPTNNALSVAWAKLCKNTVALRFHPHSYPTLDRRS